jgi:hypothetical protein
MNNYLIRYRIITNRGGGVVAGNFISVFWDDTALAIVAIKYADALDNVGAVMTSGPDLGAERYDYVSIGLRPIPYKFCDATTLNTFTVDSVFPYATRAETPNHFSCDVAVCDLKFLGVTTTDATDTVTANGSATGIADGSGGAIRYSLDPDFIGGGQESGQFTGLLAGNHTIYAKDARGCFTSIIAIVGTPQTYGPKYRLEYKDRNHRQTRVDIWERGYVDEVIEVCGGPNPFVLSFNNDGNLNRFAPIAPSEGRLTLISPENFYFRDLFSQDERKYQMRYYKDFGVIQPAVQNLPALNTYVNDDLGGALIRPNWTLGTNPSVTLPPDEDDSVFLSAIVDLPIGAIEVFYDIDVADNVCRLLFRLYHIDDPTQADEVIIPFIVGNNVGSFIINATSASNRFKIIANQAIQQFPALSTWQRKPEENREIWATGIAHPSVTLAGGTISQNLYCSYPFTAGSSYTIEIVIFKSPTSGSSGKSTMYYSGRNEAFFPLYSPFGKTFNGGTTGNYTISITFTAPENITIFAFQLFHDSTGSCGYEVTSAEITNNSSPGTTLTINELSSETEEISGLQLEWIGYVISSNYKEPYIAAKYPVTITATDGLADLNQYDFVDRYGNRFENDIVTMNAIVSILQRTDLGLNIITAVNRLEELMTDNAFKESKIDPDMFWNDDGPENTSEVLKQILKIFAVRIYQRKGKWIIQTIEEAVHEFSAQEFDQLGVFIQTVAIGDIMPITNPVLQLEGVFKERDQVLEIIPSYGNLFFTHALIQNPSLVKSYSFEEIDIYATPDGVTVFKNWNVNIGDAPGAEYGIKETKSFEGDFNFFYKIPVIPYTAPGYTLVLTSTEGLIEYSAEDYFEFRFDYATIMGTTSSTGKPRFPFWIRMKWSVRVGNYYFDEITGTWTTTKKYNDLYIEDFNDPQNYKIVGQMRAVTELSVEAFQVEFVLYDGQVFDFTIAPNDDDYAELEAIPTAALPVGYRIKGRVTGLAGRGSGINVTYYYYQLSTEDSVSENVQTRRPNDYDFDDNPVTWVLQEEVLERRARPRSGDFLKYLSQPTPELPVKYQYLDNVVLRSLPGGNEPPETITIKKVNNVNIKINFEDEFLLNDIDIETINNSERIYKNFFKRLDGSPTQIWERTYRAGTGKLMDLYSNDFLSQYKTPGNKLTGSMLVTNHITYGTVMRELFDDNKLYMFMSMELHDREYSINFDLAELKDVVNDDTSESVDAGFTSGFTLGFRA